MTTHPAEVPASFRDDGILQEVNRLFLHPLGYALAMYQAEGAPDDSPWFLMLNVTDDPEGWRFDWFGHEADAIAKADNVHALTVDAIWRRIDSLGYGTQPLPSTGTTP